MVRLASTGFIDSALRDLFSMFENSGRNPRQNAILISDRPPFGMGNEPGVTTYDQTLSQVLSFPVIAAIKD
jgi:hypothetical protein